MFRKSLVSIALLTLVTAASATGNQGCNNRCGDNSGDTTHNTTNQGGQGGHGTATAAAGAVAVGVGSATAGVVGSGNSDVRNNNVVTNTNITSNTNRNDLSNSQGQGQDQAQRQGQSQNQQTSSGAQATGGAATGNGAGNKTSVIVDASTSYERSAPAISVGGGTPLPTGCRYVFGIGGSNANGSVGASGIPLWKDSECMGAAVFAAAGRFPGVFTVQDLRVVACENFSAMESTPTCKQLKEEKRVEGILERNAAVAELKLQP